jgi:CDP-diacylglycerol pyrophosphatase
MPPTFDRSPRAAAASARGNSTRGRGMTTPSRYVLLLIFIGAALVLHTNEGHAQNRDALRQIVEDRCVPHWVQEGNPAPCERVYLVDGAQPRQGYAVLADAKGGAHFLLIPASTVPGIESPDVLRPKAPNYFAGAWQARDRVAAVVGHDVRRDDIGLAVNSQQHRSQDQLHIHIECLGKDVHQVLQAAADRLTGRWTPVTIDNRRYQGMRVTGEDLDKANPFALLAERMPGANADMGAYTLMVAGMQFKDGPGFILIAGRNVPGTEVLLDPTCAVAKR